MTENRSVPTNTVLPHICYQNVADAIDWLSKAFGFAEHYRYGDPEAISGAQMHLGNAWIMLKRARTAGASPAKLGCATQSLTVFVLDVDAQSEIGWRQNRGGSQRDLLWRTAIWGRRLGWPPLAFLATRAGSEFGGMGSQSFGDQEPAVALASPPAVLSGGSRDRRSPIGCFLRESVWLEHSAPRQCSCELR